MNATYVILTIDKYMYSVQTYEHTFRYIRRDGNVCITLSHKETGIPYAKENIMSSKEKKPMHIKCEYISEKQTTLKLLFKT